jgi:hypothetical protein
MIGNNPKVLNLNRLFLKLNQFICKWWLVLPIQWEILEQANYTQGIGHKILKYQGFICVLLFS